MAFIYCKKCGEYRYLTPHAFWNVNDLNVKCKDCGTINIITIEMGELKKNKYSTTHIHNHNYPNLKTKGLAIFTGLNVSFPLICDLGP